jgi:cell division protein FtsZ
MNPSTNPFNYPYEEFTGEIAQPVLKVIGLGGGGCNAIERMIELGMRGVEFIAANTDRQTLMSNPAPTKILLGPHVTRGLGAGGDPEKGEAAAQESWDELSQALSGADMVFLTAGMGGGTGTGSIPVVAEICRSLGAVTIAIVTMPFTFEVGRRQKNANEGIRKLRKHTHTLISIPNDRLLQVAPKNLSLEVAFRLADDVLRQSVQGITELITEPGFINVDFAHIRRLILLGGGALMAIGHGQGAKKAGKALQQALQHPLLESIPLENAAGVIANFTGSDDLTLMEVQEALEGLQSQTGSQTEIVLGVTNDDSMVNRAQVILLITGLGGSTLEEAFSQVQKANPVKQAQQSVQEHRSQEKAELPYVEPAIFSPSYSKTAATNYDIPAFLRRRNL